MKRLSVAICAIMCLAAAFSFGCGKKGEVGLKYYDSAANMLPIMVKGELEVGLLPEPAATRLTEMSEDTWYRLDVQELYDAEKKAYPQAVLMIKTSVLAAYPNVADKIGEAFGENAEWIKANAGAAVAAVNAKLEDGVTPSLTAATITEEVVRNCKIYWQSAADARKDVEKYIDDIIAIDGGSAAAVNDEFFFDGTESGGSEKDNLTVIAPDGAPALAIAKFIYDGENFDTGSEISYKVVSSNDIGLSVIRGDADIAIVPVNAASKIYKSYSADPYKLAGVVTHGNLYLMSKEKLAVKDLKDRTVGVIGMGLVPDLTFRSILVKSGMAYTEK